MRTDAVIAIVGVHDAGNPASRLTMPVSDETAGPGSWPGSSWPERQHDTGRPRPRLPAANTGTAGASPSVRPPALFLRRCVPAGRQPAVTEDAASGHSMPREDVMTEPAVRYPLPGPAIIRPRPSSDGTAPPMPWEVTNERRQRHSGGRLRLMMRRITRRP